MENNKSLIPVNTSIERIEKQITIGDKILNSQIENLFNEAFYFLNSKNVKINSQNFYLELLKDSESFLFSDFKFDAEINDDYIKAIEIFDKVISQKPNFKFAYYFRGIAFSKIDKNEESIADYTKTIELDNNFKFAFGKRARSYYQKSDWVTEYGRYFKRKENYEFAFVIDDCTKALNLALLDTDKLNNEYYLEFLFDLYETRRHSKLKLMSEFIRDETNDYDYCVLSQHIIRDYDNAIEISKKITIRNQEDFLWLYDEVTFQRNDIKNLEGWLDSTTIDIDTIDFTLFLLKGHKFFFLADFKVTKDYESYKIKNKFIRKSEKQIMNYKTKIGNKK